MSEGFAAVMSTIIYNFNVEFIYYVFPMENKNTIVGAVIAVTLVVLGIVAFVVVSGGNQTEQSDNSADSTQPSATVTSTVTVTPTMMEMNIVETAVATPDLSTLVAAVQAGGLVEALSNESAMLTVFAPTNAAFAEIQSTVDTLLLPENKADLQNVLQYHVVSGEVMSSNLEDGMTVEALNGDTLTITIRDGKVMINNAEVVIADIETSNGVVHVINKVLVP
ncbi:MAG: Immunogenic protein MPT70 precursor [candidate division WS6 bacterium OLB20]|uniref:Immunogenic protein MPT70 n=1 Tax=candidate division WS6 bacterium OLB20 TaxID=1617426 RepID=A0A136LWK2_9BACT|nr:MAG: Immunogenic protein MPT70 precursor [candidate division WS6 bacterium OLB20]